MASCKLSVNQTYIKVDGVDELVIDSSQDGLLCSHLKELDRSVCPVWEEFQH